MGHEASRVGIVRAGAEGYPTQGAFSPSRAFEEYPFAGEISSTENHVYSAVRDLFVSLGMDGSNHGTPCWNPLGDLVKPNDSVVIKPNLVVSDHPLGAAGVRSTIVNGSIIRAVIDYVLIALKGTGRITIADSPIKDTDFQKALQISGLDNVLSFYASLGIHIEVLDLRDKYAPADAMGVIGTADDLVGDPRGYSNIDLGDASELMPIAASYKRYRSTASIYENVIGERHNRRKSEYSISNTLLGADVVINLVKLKTHRKTGVTLCLKGMVGTTNEKRWLPH
ncbi:MAG: DUF362 domain-containing protein, partial [Candidatus Marsarchaeota archaeon]|nr:DUF362 domain-containing protein [Candidatus Marsarchaeota archaeon]